MLKDTIRNDFNDARKSGNAVKKAALEAVLAGVLQKEKMQVGRSVTDDEVIECLTKEIKIQNEILEMYVNKDAAVVENCRAKITYLSEYLPKQLTEEEVLELIKKLDVYSDNSPKTKGMIIKSLMPLLSGKFDKTKVNPLVEGYLNSK
ncbi:MAG: GatB/YqeY domain-containing protein [Clostridia bacterium]|nr:GatB/YqeY domain-containing protein [Clostridia bacterium]